MMGGKSSPKPPDYTGAALAQAEASREITEQQTWANRPTQNTPWGTQSWEVTPQWDPSTQQWLNTWTQNTTLDPMLQWALDNQMYLQGSRSELGGKLMGRAEQEFLTPMDWSKLPGRGQSIQGTPEEIRNQAQQAIYERSSSMLDPQWQQRESDLESKLWSRGLRPGDAAYDREMENLARDRERAYSGAQQEAIMGGGAEAQRQLGMQLETQQWQQNLREKALAEELQRRGFSLNEINALISGQQVGMPEMPGFSQASRSETPDILGATDMGYQANLARSNAQNAGFSNLLGTGAQMAGMFAFSDRRLKRDVRRIGTTPGGNALYSFEYLWGDRAVGVMADEVDPSIVAVHPSGFLMVDYSRVK